VRKFNTDLKLFVAICKQQVIILIRMYVFMSLNKIVMQTCCTQNRYRTMRRFYHHQPIFKASSLSRQWPRNTTHFTYLLY